MEIHDEFEKVVWWVLKEIKKEAYASDKENIIDFKFDTGNSKETPSSKDQSRALRFLEKIRTIKRLQDIYASPNIFSMTLESMTSSRPTVGFEIQILEKFNEVYEQFKKGSTTCNKLLKENKVTIAIDAKNAEEIDDIIQYNPDSWDLFYNGVIIHHLNDGSAAWELLKEAFKDKKVIKYEFPHNKEKNDKKRLQDKIKNFRALLQKKLKESKASQKLIDDFFIKIDGGTIKISKCFVLKP